MAKLVPFDQWKRPWADGEFDEERAAKRVYDLLKDKETLQDRNATLSTENGELQTKLTAAEDAKTDAEGKLSRAGVADTDKDSKITDLERQVRDLSRDKGKIPPEVQARIDRLEVANDFGLTAKDAARLVGATKDELVEDAKEFAARLGIEPREEPQAGSEDGATGSLDGRTVREGDTSLPPQRGVRRVTEFSTGSVQGQIYSGDTSKVLASLPPI